MTYLPAALLARGLDETPDKIAFALFGPARAERWSYARLQAAIDAVAAGLTQLGWPQGPVAITLGHGSDAIAAIFGAMAAGYAPLVMPPDADPTGCAAVIGAGGDGALPHLPREELASWIDGPAAPPPQVPPADRLGFAASDGTVRWFTAAEILTEAARWAEQAGLTAADRLMWAGRVDGPVTVTIGLCAALLAGATVLLPAAGLPPATLALLMKRHDATLFAAPPHVLSLVLDQPITTLPRLRHGVNWGAALPDALPARWQDKTGTELRDLAPPATDAERLAATVQSVDGVREAAAITLPDGRGIVVYDGTPSPDQIDAGPLLQGALWQLGGPLPRDGDGRIDHHGLIKAMERAR